MITKILVPYDFSKYATKALKYAIEIAEKFDATLYLLTVVDEHEYLSGALLGMVSSSSVSAIKKITVSAKKETAQMLVTQVSKCRAKGIKTDSKVLSGNITEEILKYAKQKKTTLIIIGSQGLHGIQKLKILGSTSRKVSELAKCPVMIVR